MHNIKIYLGFLIVFIFQDALASQGYIDLDDQNVSYYTGANVKYYKEYKPKQFEGFTSFPVMFCDPVPIDKIGALRVFFTSAIEGHAPLTGQGIVIPETQPIQQVLAVRGKSESNGYRVEAYFGYDPATYTLKGRNRTKIYKAVLLALQVKDTRYVGIRTVHLCSDARYLTNTLIGQEIKPLLSDMEDWNWKSPVFQQPFQGMLPKREGFSIVNQMIYFKRSYWTKEENRLKGLVYKGH